MNAKKAGGGPFSAAAGLCALAAMLSGAIPSAYYTHTVKPSSFYDIIQYIPSSASYAASVSLIFTALFAFLSFIELIPRLLAAFTALIALASSLTAAAGLGLGFAGPVSPSGFGYALFLFIAFELAAAFFSFCALRRDRLGKKAKLVSEYYQFRK